MLARRGFIGKLLCGIGAGGLFRFDAADTQVWTTEDGRAVRICDMSDEHLRNCIMYQAKTYGAFCFQEHTYGGSSIRRLISGSPQERFPLYDSMRREAQRRRLAWI